MNMPVTGQKSTTNEGGVDKDIFTIAFTNGALKELEELQKSLKAPDLEAVVRLGIALLRRVEEIQNDPKKAK